jgi:hypothetical protein
MLFVRRKGTDDVSQVTADVRACVDVAAPGGVQAYSSAPSGQTGVEMESHSVTIKPLVQKFDGCLIEQGYELAAPTCEFEGGGWRCSAEGSKAKPAALTKEPPG